MLFFYDFESDKQGLQAYYFDHIQYEFSKSGFILIFSNKSTKSYCRNHLALFLSPSKYLYKFKIWGLKNTSQFPKCEKMGGIYFSLCTPNLFLHFVNKQSIQDLIHQFDYFPSYRVPPNYPHAGNLVVISPTIGHPAIFPHTDEDEYNNLRPTTSGQKHAEDDIKENDFVSTVYDNRWFLAPLVIGTSLVSGPPLFPINIII